MKCELVNKGIVKEKGNPSLEFYKNGKPQYYCMGYIDLMTDMEFLECRQCKRYVLQAEKDHEEAKRLG